MKLRMERSEVGFRGREEFSIPQVSQKIEERVLIPGHIEYRCLEGLCADTAQTQTNAHVADDLWWVFDRRVGRH